MNKKQLIVACLVLGIFAYTGYEIHRLSNRIERIENKLGGSKKIACNKRDTVEKVRRSVVRIVGGEGEGSGFAIKKDGFILTNFHVIASEPDPKVILPDNTFETGEVIMADKDADLAVIKIKKGLPAVRFARLGWMHPAEEILAIGYPLGGGLPGESFVIQGSFSRSVKDKENGVEYLLTDMTMVSGISGGPMVNICGEVVGVNTSGLFLGGMGMAVSSDSIIEKYRQMSASKDPLKDVKKTVFQPNKNSLEAIRCFYNYLKARKLEKAFELLSDNFVVGYSFEQWARGYRPLLDTSIVIIKPDKKIADRIHVKLSTKDFVDDEIVYKYFEGYWDVRQ
ncbi:MAG: S1C family serine protease, partial [Candidatus Omnitrophota bacterium]